MRLAAHSASILRSPFSAAYHFRAAWPQAERPETLNDRALQLVIGERIKLDGCADTRDKARGLRSTLRSCQTNCEGDQNGLGGLCHQNLVG